MQLLGDKFMVYSGYDNPLLVEKFVRLGGELTTKKILWIKYTGWVFVEDNRAEVEILLSRFRKVSLVNAIFTFDSEEFSLDTPPQIDGIDLVQTRAGTTFLDGQTPTIVPTSTLPSNYVRVLEVATNTVKSMRSVRVFASQSENSYSGRLVVKVKCRPDAVVGPDNWNPVRSNHWPEQDNVTRLLTSSKQLADFGQNEEK